MVFNEQLRKNTENQLCFCLAAEWYNQKSYTTDYVHKHLIHLKTEHFVR